MENTLAYSVPRRINPALLWSSVLLGFLVVGFFTMLLSAQVKVPFYPVAITLQTFATAIIAFTAAGSVAAVNWKQRLGAVSLALSGVTPYVMTALALGKPYSASNPFFSGGYLVGFILMAVVISFGWTFRKNGSNNLILALFLAVLGTMLVHVPGLPVLHNAMLTLHPEQTFWTTFYQNAILFAPGDLLKAGLVACLATVWSGRKTKA